MFRDKVKRENKSLSPYCYYTECWSLFPMFNVLLINTYIVNRTGSELYIRDVAHALLKRGHTPIVYSPRLGELADEIRRLGIPVTDDLDTLAIAPDIIHGQHHIETMTALARFPHTPAVYFYHGWQPWVETPPHHPRILHYVGVTERARARLTYEYAIPSEQISLIYNFADLERFVPRAPLPSRPKRALLLSNHAQTANPHDFSHVIREACEAEQIALDVVGLTNGNPTAAPETLLMNYDLVFGRGRVVLEAAAVGNAVICCDVEGAGPMVSMENMDTLRRHNFGMFILDKPITRAGIAQQITCYDSDDAARVSAKIREVANMETAVDQIVAIYERVFTRASARPSPDFADEQRALYRYFYWMSGSLPHQLAALNDTLTHEKQSLIRKNEGLLQRLESLERDNDGLKGKRSPRHEAQWLKPLRTLYRAVIPLRWRLSFRDAWRSILFPKKDV